MPEPEPTAATPAVPPRLPTGDESAVEWRLAWPDGQQFGPTVPTVFAQWIAAGRVPTDALVWRTGWADWRKASDAAADLPAPLPGSESAAETPRGVAAGVTLPPSPPDSAEDASIEPVVAPAKPAPTGAYALRRRREARRRRYFTIALAIDCLALLGMLIAMMMSGPPEGAPVVPQ
ncbi:MAG: GYF domain-containing protein [Planctomycetota bacterium]